MAKLLLQADDYGLTHSTADGILKGIREGVIKNTGLFANMPSSSYAASQIKHYPNTCFGQDINLVAGRPISNPSDIPSLVDKEGRFITSHARLKSNKIIVGNGVEMMFETDPYPYEETYFEVENQVKRFIELVGKKPTYLHGHSLITPNIMKAIREVAKKYDIVVSFDLMEEKKIFSLPCTWTPKPFPIEEQLKVDVEAELLKVLPQVLKHEISAFICHAGFVEEDLFRETSYTIIRQKDLFAMCSPRIKEFIEANNIELITYDDLKGGK